jgi:hypothetical protein
MMMKARDVQHIIFLVIFFLFANQTWAADWIYYDSASVGDVYYDKSSIKKLNESIISVQNKYILSQEAKTKYFSILKGIQKAPDNHSMLSYYTNLMEIDCVNKKIKDISMIFFDDKGEIFYSSPKGEVGDWNDILPHTVGEKLMSIVSCDPVAPKEAVVAPMVEEPVAPKEAVAAAPAVTDKYLAPINSKRTETKNVQNLINKWLTSWKSGDINTYRSCYASDFLSGGMNLDEWVSHRTNVYQKSKNINISIKNLNISEEVNSASAEFTQSYSSSISKYSGKKKLKLKKINDKWKIYREVLN